MPKELVISAAAHETRVALLEDGQLCEIYIEREKEFALVGSIYKGRVTRVLPGMQSAFVEIGLDSDAFLYVGDFLENLEDYDHVVSAVEGKVEKMEQQGGAVFAPAASAEAAAPEVPAPSAPSVDEGEGSHDSHAADGHESLADIREPESRSPESRALGEHPPATQPFVPPARPFVRQERRPGPSAGPGANQGSSLPGQPGQSSGQRFGQQTGGYRAGQGQPQGPREGQGRDRGGRQRGGRFRRGRGGEPRSGRDLPPSKYASPRPFSPSSLPYEPPAEEPAADYTPVILPGESLAKYKDRLPAAASAANQHAQSETPSGVAAPALPPSLYAEPGRASAAPAAESHESVHNASAEPQALLNADVPVELESEAGLTEPDTRLHETQQTLAHETLPETFEISHENHEAPGISTSMAELSDDEATALAEQLAEARQEESSADLAAAARIADPSEAEDEREDDEASASQPFVESAAGEHDVAENQASETNAAEIHTGQDEDEEDDVVESDLHEVDVHEATLNVDADVDEDVEDSDAGHVVTNAQPGDELDRSEAPTESFGGIAATADAAGSESDRENRGNVAPAVPQQRPLSARISDPQRARFQRPMRRGNRQRGSRNVRPQDHRQQPARRPQLISEMLKAGQEIIVQIAKEPLGKKGARITSHVALPGRFLVYMPTVNHIGVSRRIGSAEERARLRRIVTESKGTFPGGFIVRTAAEGAPEDEIRSDVEFLGRTWDKIRAQAEPRKSPALLHRDLNLIERILRDYVSNDYTAIWIDNEEEFGKVVDFVSRFQPKLVSRVKLYTKPSPIFEEFGIQQELDKALRPKVWLKSGGYIVINHTEALVAIDVNTGKYVGRGSTRLEDTIVKTNLEAVKEIIRQIRLRDLGGIIVLDLIDMEERRNREKVMAALEAALRADRAPSKALPFNEFGLIAVTRKRTKQALERVLCQPCPYCTGSGMVKSVPTICYEIQAEAKKMSADLDASSLTLRVHPEIAKALKTREAMLIEELEQATRKSVIIQADPTLHWEQYDIY